MNYQSSKSPAASTKLPRGVIGQPVEARLADFRFRTTLCEACDDGYMLDDAGLTAGRCDECDGTVKVDASCVGCGNVLPLNSEGECRRCFDAGELPVAAFDAKYLAAGWNRVEL